MDDDATAAPATTVLPGCPGSADVEPAALPGSPPGFPDDAAAPAAVPGSESDAAPPDAIPGGASAGRSPAFGAATSVGR